MHGDAVVRVADDLEQRAPRVADAATERTPSPPQVYPIPVPRKADFEFYSSEQMFSQAEQAF
jgi:hypothetical protein